MNRKDPRVIKTLRQLNEALLSNLERYPFREITLAMICQDAMINKTTFYKHYRDKYDYLDRYLDQLLQQFREQIKVDFILASPERINDAVYQDHFRELMAYLLRHKREYYTLWQAKIDRPFYNEMTDVLYQSILESIVRSPEYGGKKQLQYELYAHLFATHAMALFHWWFDHEDKISPAEVQELMNENMSVGFFKAFKHLK